MNDVPYITLSDIKILVSHPPQKVELIIRSSQFVDQLKQPRSLGREMGATGNPVASLPLSVFKQMVADGLLILRPRADILVGVPGSRLGNPKVIMEKHDLESWIKDQKPNKFAKLPEG